VACSIAQEFLEHANDEQNYADQIGERIVQLGGEPKLSPEDLASRSRSEYFEGDKLIDMIKEDLVAERFAIDSYRDFGDAPSRIRTASSEPRGTT
jgi:bacterioferritin